MLRTNQSIEGRDQRDAIKPGGTPPKSWPTTRLIVKGLTIVAVQRVGSKVIDAGLDWGHHVIEWLISWLS